MSRPALERANAPNPAAAIPEIKLRRLIVFSRNFRFDLKKRKRLYTPVRSKGFEITLTLCARQMILSRT